MYFSLKQRSAQKRRLSLADDYKYSFQTPAIEGRSSCVVAVSCFEKLGGPFSACCFPIFGKQTLRF